MSAPADTFLTDSRQRLIEAAKEVFMEEGYRASMDRIAAHAGVARQTLYNHFPGKDDLFGEVVRQAAATILVTLEAGGKDVRLSLLAFAQAFCTRVLSREGLAFYRTIVGEAGRFPELAKAFFAKGPEQTANGLAAYLELAMIDGRLRRDDSRLAAELLLGMLSGFERTRRLCGAPATAQAAEAIRVTAIVDCFLRAYAPERNQA